VRPRSKRGPATSTNGSQGGIWACSRAAFPRCYSSGSGPRQRQRPTGPVQRLAVDDEIGIGTPGRPWPRSWPGSPSPRLASATASSTRNLYNLVATGALDQREVDQGLLEAADRCGLLAQEPRQTHRTLASGRQVGLAHPGRPAHPTSPDRTHASPPPRAVGEPTKERG
jgi:hypothetical protein